MGFCLFGSAVLDTLAVGTSQSVANSNELRRCMKITWVKVRFRFEPSSPMLRSAPEALIIIIVVDLEEGQFTIQDAFDPCRASGVSDAAWNSHCPFQGARRDAVSDYSPQRQGQECWTISSRPPLDPDAG